jgi:hypothetical protein
MGQLRGSSNLLELLIGLPDPTMDLLDAGVNPGHRLMGLADQQLGRGQVISDALVEPPARAGHRLVTTRFHGALRPAVCCSSPTSMAAVAVSDKRWAVAGQWFPLGVGVAKRCPGRR